MIEQFEQLPTVRRPTVSPSGDTVAVYYDEGGKYDIYLIDTETGQRRQLTEDGTRGDPDWWMQWLTDEELCYHASSGGDEHHDIRSVTRDETHSSLLELPGQAVLHDTSESGDKLLIGSTHDGSMELYLSDADGIQKISDQVGAIGDAVMTQGGRRIAFSASSSDDPQTVKAFLHREGDTVALGVGEQGTTTKPVDWGPEGERLLIYDDSSEYSRAGIYDITEECIRWIGESTFPERPMAFFPDGEKLLLERDKGTVIQPVVVTVNDNSESELGVSDGVTRPPFGGNPVVDNDRVLLLRSTSEKRTRIVVYNTATDEQNVLLAPPTDPLNEDSFRSGEAFSFESSDGVSIDGIVYDSGLRPSPLLVFPHGGPRTADRLSFDIEVQFLTELGFTVLQVNYRGSTGRGQAFRTEIHGDIGRREQADIAEATRLFTQKPWISENDVAVFGKSYGGYSCYWQLFRYPELYDAGVAYTAMSDLMALYRETLPHYRTAFLEQYVGDPETQSRLYEERSPINQADSLACPLLILHGKNDSRVPVSQARLLRDRLRQLGYDFGPDGTVEYVEIGEVGHNVVTRDHRTAVFNHLEDFFSRRLKM